MPTRLRPPESHGGSGNLLGGLTRLAAGDLVARILGFLALVYLARTLGVEAFGTLEFGLSALLYFTLAADAGLEVWATREVARSDGIPGLAGTVAALRAGLGTLGFLVLLLSLPLLPDFPGLDRLLLVLGICLPVQGASLKWAFLGRERMGVVAGATVLGQLVFAGGVVLLVHRPDALLVVGVLKVAGEGAASFYYGVRLFRDWGLEWTLPSASTARRILGSALPLGASEAMGLLSYNFDTLFLGFMRGAAAVGWYGAAYKPVVAMLAVPLTYFRGLFPALSRTHADDPAAFRRLIHRSLNLTAAAAVLMAVGATFLAGPVVELLFGSEYTPAASALRILGWSAALVVLRGTLRHGLRAANRADLDLRCAALATGANLALNLVLIPSFGVLGAACATVASEAVWLMLLLRASEAALPTLHFGAALVRPLGAGAGMALSLALTSRWHPGLAGAVAVVTYAALLLVSGWRFRGFGDAGAG